MHRTRTNNSSRVVASTRRRSSDGDDEQASSDDMDQERYNRNSGTRCKDGRSIRQNQDRSQHQRESSLRKARLVRASSVLRQSQEWDNRWQESVNTEEEGNNTRSASPKNVSPRIVSRKPLKPPTSWSTQESVSTAKQLSLSSGTGSTSASGRAITTQDDAEHSHSSDDDDFPEYFSHLNQVHDVEEDRRDRSYPWQNVPETTTNARLSNRTVAQQNEKKMDDSENRKKGTFFRRNLTPTSLNSSPNYDKYEEDFVSDVRRSPLRNLLNKSPIKDRTGSANGRESPLMATTHQTFKSETTRNPNHNSPTYKKENLQNPDSISPKKLDLKLSKGLTGGGRQFYPQNNNTKKDTSMVPSSASIVTNNSNATCTTAPTSQSSLDGSISLSRGTVGQDISQSFSSTKLTYASSSSWKHNRLDGHLLSDHSLLDDSESDITGSTSTASAENSCKYGTDSSYLQNFESTSKSTSHSTTWHTFRSDSFKTNDEKDLGKSSKDADTTQIICNRAKDLSETKTGPLQDNDDNSVNSQSSEDTSVQIAQCIADLHQGSVSHARATDSTARHDSGKDLVDVINVNMTQSQSMSQTKSISDIPEQKIDNPSEEVQVISSAAAKLLLKGDFAHALELFQRVLQLHVKTFGAIHPLVASTHHNIGIVYLKHISSIEENAQPKAAVANLRLENDSATFSHEAKTQLAQLRILALSSFRDAALIARQSLGNDHPNIATSLVRIGFLLLDVGQHFNALATFHEALRIRKATFGENDLLVSKVYNNIGVAHLKLGDYQEGFESFLRALKAQRWSLERIDNTNKISTELENKSQNNCYAELDIANTLYNLGSLSLDWAKKYEEKKLDLYSPKELVGMSMKYFEEVVSIRSRLLGPSHIQTIHAQVLLKRAKIEEKNIIWLSYGKKDVNTKKPEKVERVTACAKPIVSKDKPQPSRPTSTIPRESMQIKKAVDQKSMPNVALHIPRSSHRSQNNATLTSETFVSSSSPVIPSFRLNSAVQDNRNLLQSSSQSKISGTVDEVVENVQENSNLIQSSSHSKISVYVDEAVENRFDEEESCLISAREQVDDTDDEDENPIAMSRNHDQKRITVQRPTQEDRPFLNSQTRSNQSESNSRRPLADSSLIVSEAKFRKGTKNASNQHNEYFHPMTMDEIEEDYLKDPVKLDLATTSVPVNENELEKNPTRYSLEIHNAAVNCMKEGSYDESLKWFRILLDTQRNVHGEVHVSVGSTLHNIGIVCLKAERYEDALDALEQAVRVRKGSIGKDNADVAESLVKVGIVLLLLKRFDDALFSFREALSIRRHALGHLHPTTARIYNNIGCVHVEFNEMREARRAFEYALDIQRNALCYEPNSGPLLFGTATTLCNLGYLYTFRGMHQRASVVLFDALGLQEQVLGKNHPTVLTTLDNLADAYGKSGECAQAMRCYKEIINRLDVDIDKVIDSEHSSSKRRQRAAAVTLYKMSGIHCQQNDLEAALNKLKIALTYAGGMGSVGFMARIKGEMNRLKNEIEKNDMEWI